jgi:hypothetical protein
MLPEEITAHRRTPGSVGDWEELLVRLEIVPRVARNAIEDLGDGDAAAVALSAAVAREAAVGRWLEEAAGVAGGGRGVEAPEGGDGRADELSLRFASLRARTFAMLQRRGLEVWEWEAPVAGRGGVRVTAHQLLLWLARRDAELLAALREATTLGRAAC